VKSCEPDKNKNKISAGSQAVASARIAPKICQDQPPTMYSECSRFHPNWFIFGGVIAERVNTAKLRPTVIPIFASKPHLEASNETCCVFVPKFVAGLATEMH